MQVRIQVKENVTAFMARLGDVIRSGEIENAMGRGATNVVRRHLNSLESGRPNKEGWPRQHFWAKCSRSTSYTSQPGAAVISISHLGFRQRLQGGPIRARNVKYLTIPATAEAYGKRAREFSNLSFGYAENKNGNLAPALIKRSATRSSKGRLKGKDAKKNIGNVMYWLTPGVFQRGDPTVLPDGQKIVDGALSAADKFMRSREGLR